MEELGYSFQVGSLKFQKFKELYDSIKDRTGSTNLQCAILDDKGAHIVSFLLNYEKSTAKHRFAYIMEPSNMTTLKAHENLYSLVRPELPRFQVVGSMVSTASDMAGPARKLYGYRDIAGLK